MNMEFSDKIIDKINNGNVINVSLEFIINNVKINRDLILLIFKDWSNS